MKFQWKMDRRQNLRAWKEYYLISARTEYDSLSKGEKKWLQGLNESLREFENKYSVIMDTKYIELQARVSDTSNWLMEFNLEYVITFYLRDDDPEYDEEDDNILMEIDNLYLPDRDWGLGSTHVDHAEPRECFPCESHCFLYHELYGHCNLDWRDLFRIGAVYMEIKIEEQSGVLPISLFR